MRLARATSCFRRGVIVATHALMKDGFALRLHSLRMLFALLVHATVRRILKLMFGGGGGKRSGSVGQGRVGIRRLLEGRGSFFCVLLLLRRKKRVVAAARLSELWDMVSAVCSCFGGVAVCCRGAGRELTPRGGSVLSLGRRTVGRCGRDVRSSSRSAGTPHRDSRC